jgi:hypothetical protein
MLASLISLIRGWVGNAETSTESLLGFGTCLAFFIILISLQRKRKGNDGDNKEQ